MKKFKVRLLVFFIILSFSGCAGLSESKRQQYIRKNFVNSNPNISEEFRDLILAGEINAGMTKDQVKASLGDPDYYASTNKWHYGFCSIGCKILEFENKNGVDVLKKYYSTDSKQQIREEFVEQHPDLDTTTRNAIVAGSVQIGMTKQQVGASWGYPTSKSLFGYSSGTSEQWIYGDCLPSCTILDFNTSGKLTSFYNSHS